SIAAGVAVTVAGCGGGPDPPTTAPGSGSASGSPGIVVVTDGGTAPVDGATDVPPTLDPPVAGGPALTAATPSATPARAAPPHPADAARQHPLAGAPPPVTRCPDVRVPRRRPRPGVRRGPPGAGPSGGARPRPQPGARRSPRGGRRTPARRGSDLAGRHPSPR